MTDRWTFPPSLGCPSPRFGLALLTLYVAAMAALVGVAVWSWLAR